MQTTRDIERKKINAPKANCTEKGSNKASDGNQDYPNWENLWTKFTENYYEAMGGYVALMANENYPEYFNANQQ